MIKLTLMSQKLIAKRIYYLKRHCRKYLGINKSGQKIRTPVSSAILKLITDNFLDYWPLYLLVQFQENKIENGVFLLGLSDAE